MTDLDPRWVRALRDQSDLSAPDAAAWAEVRARAESGEPVEPDAGGALGASAPRRRPVLVAAAAAAVLLAALALTALALRGDGGSHRLVVGATTTILPGLPETVEADATVLESQDHGPQLCLGAITASLPPQCGGARSPTGTGRRSPASTRPATRPGATTTWSATSTAGRSG